MGKMKNLFILMVNLEIFLWLLDVIFKFGERNILYINI